MNMPQHESSPNPNQPKSLKDLAEKLIAEILLADPEQLEGQFRGLAFVVAQAGREGLLYGADEIQSAIFRRLQKSIFAAQRAGHDGIGERLHGIFDVYADNYQYMPGILDEDQVKELMFIEESGLVSIEQLSDWAASRYNPTTQTDEEDGITTLGIPIPNRNLAYRRGMAGLSPRGKSAIEAYFRFQARMASSEPKVDQPDQDQ